MRKYLVVQACAALSSSEKRRVRSFLNARHSEKANLLHLLFDHICKHLSSPKLNPEDTWKALFDTEPIQNNLFRSLCSQLNREIDDFLIELEVERNEAFRKILLLRQLARRGLTKAFHIRALNLEKTLQASCFRDEEYYSILYEL